MTDSHWPLKFPVILSQMEMLITNPHAFCMSSYTLRGAVYGSCTGTHSPMGGKAKMMLISRWLKGRHLEPIRDNLGQMWPTDPRHSWWKRNRCCGSPEDSGAWTPGSASEAQILPSERSCPPLQGERENGCERGVIRETEEVKLTGWKWKKRTL